MLLDAALLAHAAELELGFSRLVLTIRIDSPQSPNRVRTAAHEAVHELLDTELFWEVVGDPAGVLIRQWGHTADIGEVLRRLAAQLAARGVAGVLRADSSPKSQGLSRLRKRPAELLECYVRFDGERYLGQNGGPKHPVGEPFPRWAANPDAATAGIDAALDWLANAPSRARFYTPNGRCRDFEELRELVVWDLRSSPRVYAWWEYGGAFRILGVFGAWTWNISTRLSIAEGRADLSDGGWRPVYEELRGFLLSAAEWAPYGLIKRGRRPIGIGSLHSDWLPSYHYGSRYDLPHSAYEDVLAPDAFGVQLLGPGYNGRYQATEEWRLQDAARGAHLLEHRDLPAWFAEPLPREVDADGGRAAREGAYPMPEVVVRSRQELAPILLHQDHIRSRALHPPLQR